MAEEKRDFRGIWIPKEVWLDKKLSAIEKVILAEIDSMSSKRGFYASNAYLSEFCQCSERYITQSISKLIKLKYIEVVAFNGRQRFLKSNLKSTSGQISKDCEAESQKDESHYNNNYYNNNYNNNKDNNKDNNHSCASDERTPNNSEAAEYNEQLSDGSPKQESKQSKPPNIYKDIVDYLNKKTGKRYRHTTGANQRLIRARQNEGFVLQDFYAVIDVKCSQWLDDAKMSAYLRPETLFGTKFESYLNESGAKQPLSNSASPSPDSDYDENGVRIRSC